jgi:hypothetical protein
MDSPPRPARRVAIKRSPGSRSSSSAWKHSSRPSSTRAAARPVASRKSWTRAGRLASVVRPRLSTSSNSARDSAARSPSVTIDRLSTKLRSRPGISMVSSGRPRSASVSRARNASQGERCTLMSIAAAGAPAARSSQRRPVTRSRNARVSLTLLRPRFGCASRSTGFCRVSSPSVVSPARRAQFFMRVGSARSAIGCASNRVSSSLAAGASGGGASTTVGGVAGRSGSATWGLPASAIAARKGLGSPL